MFVRFKQLFIHATRKFLDTPNYRDSRGWPIQERENFGKQPFHRNEISKVIVSDVYKIKLVSRGLSPNLSQCCFKLRVEAWDYQFMADKW
jgi:hypothetical protein